MANDVGSWPKRIDTFGADVTLDSGVCSVHAMYITAYTSAKTVTFIDNNAANVLVLEVAAGTTAQVTPAKPLNFPAGLKFDDSASGLAAGDFIFVFGKD